MSNKPFWSIMIPTYNCGSFLKETIHSVLIQDLGPDEMQIEVIDDCSDEDIESIVKDFGKGRVHFFRQERNVGHIENFKTALSRAKGEVVHLLHGDDFVHPEFYKKMREVYINNPNIGACFSRFFFIDSLSNIINVSPLLSQSNGILSNFFLNQIRSQQVQTPSITVKRQVYEQIGTFNESLSWTEDWEMWARIGKHFEVGHIKDVLASYRVHQNSSSGKKGITGENIKDLLKLKEILLNYAPIDSRDDVSKSLNRTIFTTALNNYIENRIKHPISAISNLKVMSKYSENLKDRVKFKLMYLVKLNIGKYK